MRDVSAEMLVGRGMHAMCAAVVLLLLAWVWSVRRRLGAEREVRRHLQAVFGEMHAYALLDVRGSVGEDGGISAKRVCRTVVEKSVFRRAAVLLRDGDGRMAVTASVGCDDLTVQALERWGVDVPDGALVAGKMSTGMEAAFGRRVGRASYEVRLERRRVQRGEATHATQIGCRGMIVIPLWTGAGRLVGVMAVCRHPGANGAMCREEQVVPLEALATKLGRMIENRILSDRLMRAEKLAGLGQLAGGVAHALNNPLTAVMGYAELIADTAAEAGVQRRARVILSEAKRMHGTVENLMCFWRPQVQAEGAVEIARLLEEIEDACAGRLDGRGVRLEVQTGAGLPLLRGNRERLREALEHLLNNAAQAISAVQEVAGQRPELAAAAAEEHVIRISANLNAGALRLIVSDTGPGFKEPRRVFDPFYTTQQPGGGPGLGLSLCYAIVREHGGEISAFNLHPRGAAVVLELPLRETLKAEQCLVVGDVA